MSARSNTNQNGIGIMIENLADQATAVTALRAARDSLYRALSVAEDAMDYLRQIIVLARPSGLLTVDEIAQAIDRDRNYVDSVWSNHIRECRKAGSEDHEPGKQTRVSTEGVSESDVQAATRSLNDSASRQRVSAGAVTIARAERDRVVALVYASRLLGPTAIANEVGVDRNHVLRLARRAGIAPAHRQGSRNQYSDNRA